MRKILFRGKTLEERGMLPAGSWITGGYYVDYCYGGCPEGKHYIVTWNSMGPGGFTDLVRVDPATVGQNTGIVDCIGAQGYEGDIIKFSGGDFFTYEDQVGEIVWGSAEYLISHDDEILCSLSELRNFHDGTYQIEVIGNIHDNPELLESE